MNKYIEIENFNEWGQKMQRSGDTVLVYKSISIFNTKSAHTESHNLLLNLNLMDINIVSYKKTITDLDLVTYQRLVRHKCQQKMF